MKNSSGSLEQEYRSRINKTMDYIESDLGRQFTLEELASVANFSRFHFHRIFLGMVGETPFQFIQRLRLERIASLVQSQPRESITDIAFRCGFQDLSVFSRSFRASFGLSATEFRKTSREKSNTGQVESNTCQSDQKVSMYFCFETKTIKWRSPMKSLQSVEVKALPEMTVAYFRHTGPYKGNGQLFESLWNKLFSWAGPRGLIGGPGFNSLIIYHDDPNITSEDKLRMSVCITVPADTKVAGEIGRMVVEGGHYVMARFQLGEKEFQEAWEWVYGSWFPSSGYQPDDKPCFEMYPEEPRDGKFTVVICVPVKPM